MMYYGTHMGGWGYLFMGLSSLLFWAALIAGVVLLVRYLTQVAGTGNGSGRQPERTLAERYARGEIDDDEYRRRLSTLRGANPGH